MKLHGHTVAKPQRTAGDVAQMFVLLLIGVTVGTFVLFPDTQADAYGDEPTPSTQPDTTEPIEPTETTTWPSSPSTSTMTSSTTSSIAGASSAPPPTSLSPSTTSPSSPTTSLTPSASTDPAPSSTVSVAPPPTPKVWDCPLDGLIRRADNCDIDPCVADDGTGSSTSYTVVPWHQANGYTSAYAVSCLITPDTPPAATPTLPTTGNTNGPLMAAAMFACVLGAICAAVARRKPTEVQS